MGSAMPQEAFMNWDQIQGSWKQLKEKWLLPRKRDQFMSRIRGCLVIKPCGYLKIVCRNPPPASVVTTPRVD